MSAAIHKLYAILRNWFASGRCYLCEFSDNSVELKLNTKHFTRIKTTNFKLKGEETLEKGTYFQTTIGDVTTPDCVDSRNNGCLQEPMKNEI